MRSREVLDISPRRPIMQLERVVGGEKAWTGSSVPPQDWLVALTDRAKQEIAVMVKTIRENPLPSLLLSPDQFELPECRQVMAEVRRHLVDGMGLAVVDRMPIDELGREDTTKAYYVLGQCLGRIVATKWDGTILYDVMDTGREPAYGVRGSWTNTELYFHTDNAYGTAPPDFVSLYCLHPAVEGGVSRFCSLYHVHNEMFRRHPRLLGRLYRPVYFDRQAEHAPDDAKVSWVPVFRYDGEKLHARLAPGLVRKGYELMGEEMDAELTDAVAALGEIMKDESIWVEFTIEKGQMQYLDNRDCAHFRSEFKDHDDPMKKRHLVRLWYRDSGRRFYGG